MTRDEVLNLMASMEQWIRGQMLTSVRRIILLLTTYNFDGKDFRFDSNANLEASVDNLLTDLLDTIEQEIRRRAVKAADDDDTDIIPLLADRDVHSRLEAHVSNLKTILQAFIGTMIARKVSVTLQPALFPSYLETTAHQFGKGVTANPAKGMGFIGKDFIYLAYTDKMLKGFIEKGAVGYQVYRGSGYDCELCDDICFEGGVRKTYSFTDDIPVPSHPHCVCYVVPVYPDDLM